MKTNRTTITLLLASAAIVLIYAINPVENSLSYFVLFSCSTCAVITWAFVTSYKLGCLLNFFSIADAFIGIMFLVRPLQILLSENINDFSVFWRYSRYYEYLTVRDLPWAQAALIGFIGTVFLNIPHFSKAHNTGMTLYRVSSSQEDYRFSKNQILGCLVVSAVSLISAGIYSIKILRDSSLHIYDLLWVFLFSCLFIYIIARKRNANFFIYLVIALAIILLSFRGRRQYAFNMILCYICPLYFAGKDRKKTFLRLLVMALVAAVVILVFGNVRRGVGAVLIQESLFEGFLGEFCMFDMLLVSLKYCKDNAVGLFWGFNYLSIFTVPIPGVDIQQFDHMFTGILFKERFRGGIPTSLFGSLYFNFSYIGVCLGTVLFGTLLSFIQRKLQLLSNYASIGYYSIFATFVYDLIRVGDIGREAWSLITFLLIYVVFQFFMNKVAKDR